MSRANQINNFTSAPRLWQVFMNFLATTPLHVPNLCSKHYFLISLLVFHRIFLITSFMRVPITNQLIQSTLLFPLSIPSIQYNFRRRRFCSFFLIVRLQKFLLHDRHGTVSKECRGLQAPDGQQQWSTGPKIPGIRPSWRATPAAPVLPLASRQKKPEPLPVVQTG